MAPKLGREILYLSQADVIACGLTPAEINAAVEAIFRAKAEGAAWTQPKLAIFRPDGASFRAKGGAVADYGAMKWFGYYAGNERYELPDFVPLVVLNEGRSGMPIAVMDGVWLSAVRTASITAAAAKYMARPEAKSIGFVGCGKQARSNLAALLPLFPLESLVAYSRRASTAHAFAEEARRHGLEAQVVTDARAAISGLDIVVSCVAHGALKHGFLDASELSPGTFVSMVDLGYSWHRATLASLDRVICDDLEQSGPGGSEKLNFDGTYAGEIADIVSRKIPGRVRPEERNAIIFSGVGLADTAAAIAIYEAARKRGIGTTLPL
jgi:ornithine cyclodeaminase/alanine dehydrogenase